MKDGASPAITPQAWPNELIKVAPELAKGYSRASHIQQTKSVASDCEKRPGRLVDVSVLVGGFAHSLSTCPRPVPMTVPTEKGAEKLTMIVGPLPYAVR